MIADAGGATYTRNMEIIGRVDHGVIVLQGETRLPEGAVVRILYDPAPADIASPGGGIVEFPLVRSKYPGSVHLTNQRIQEILDEDDLAPRH